VLPAPGQAPAGTPTACSALPFLSGAEPSTTIDGGTVCTVAQLAVSGTSAPSGSGWFYDDFSDEAAEACQGAAPSRVGYTADAQPPTGVRAFLDCGQ
jgi:hypothetical protein